MTAEGIFQVVGQDDLEDDGVRRVVVMEAIGSDWRSLGGDDLAQADHRQADDPTQDA